MEKQLPKPLIFISHSVQNQSLTTDFITRFEKFHKGQFEIYHDRRHEAGDYNELILGKAKICQIAVLLISQSFIASKYCNEEEIRIFMGRSKNELIIVPILFQKCDFQAWNKPHNLKFFQSRFEDFRGARRPDKFGSIANKEDVVYEELPSEDFERYHNNLNLHIQECYDVFLKEKKN